MSVNENKSPIRGVHHLVLNTDNMAETLDFYVCKLGMKLVHGMLTPPGGEEFAAERGNPPYAQIPHYFLDMGNDSLLAFFEMPKGSEPAGHRNAIGNMQHLAFACSPVDFNSIKDRLEKHEIHYFGPVVVAPPSLNSLYFFDPNGIRLEFVADFADGPHDVRVVERMRLPSGQLRNELHTITTDEELIDQLVSLSATDQ